MQALLNDPMSFYALSFALFFALVWRYGRKPLLLWIDAEIVKVRKELDEAKRLRAEAEATLEAYKVRQETAMAEAEAIIRHAQEEAARIREQAETDLLNELALQEKRALECIRLAEADAVEEARRQIVHAAVSEARALLLKDMDTATAARLMDQAIAEMPKPFGAKMKAA